MSRRIFLKNSLLFALSGIGILFGLRSSYAARMAGQFASQTFADAVARLFGTQNVIDTDQITLSLPKTAEDGSVVPITISSELDGIQSIYVLVEKNPTPLAAKFTFTGAAMLYVSARIKMAESANVVIIAKQGDQLLKIQQWVDVVQGGCGTG